MHTFRRGEMDARVADLNAAVPGRQLDGPSEIDGFAIRRHLNKLYRHRRGLALGGIGVKNGQPAAGGEPEPSVGGAPAAAACGIAGSALRAAQSVLESIVDRVQRRNFMK